MPKPEQIDALFRAVLQRFFLIPARQPASGRVTFAQMRLLWTLEWQKNATLKELAGALTISNSTATELVDRLVRGGYVRRERSTTDRRQIQITLVPRGRRLLAQFARGRQERFEKLTRAVGTDDVRRMVRALETLGEVLTKYHGR